MSSTRILVCGGRDYSDYAKVKEVLDEKRKNITGLILLIHGAATGADELAGTWARATPGVQEVRCPAHWNLHGRAAGPIRNHNMLELLRGYPSLVVAFPGGKGTANMVRQAQRANMTIDIRKV